MVLTFYLLFYQCCFKIVLNIFRKIKDYVQGLTSATQIAEWLKLLRYVFYMAILVLYCSDYECISFRLIIIDII